MNFIEQNIKGLYLIEPQLYNDNRGLFYESWTINELNKRISKKINFIQENISISKKNVFRGFHYQKYPFEQNKLLKVINGSIYDICIDIRKNSETFLKIFELKIKSSDNKILFIPKGIAHGFLSLENKTKISYLVDVKYSPLHEEGIIYNDSNLMIKKNLKNKNFIISNKDKKLKNIKNLGFI